MLKMSKIHNLHELKSYILRKLGDGLITVNVTEEQVEDRISDALRYYIERHTDAQTTEFIFIKVNEEDIEHGYIQLPNSIDRVIRIVDIAQDTDGNIGTGGSGSSFGLHSDSSMYNHINFNSFASQCALKLVYGDRVYGGGISSYMINKYYANAVNGLLKSIPVKKFDPIKNRLYFTFNISEGMVIALEVVKKLTEEEYRIIFNDEWFLKYATELVRRQWGDNLTKYTHMLTTNGMDLNGTDIREQANIRIAELEDEMKEMYSHYVHVVRG